MSTRNSPIFVRLIWVFLVIGMCLSLATCVIEGSAVGGFVRSVASAVLPSFRIGTSHPNRNLSYQLNFAEDGVVSESPDVNRDLDSAASYSVSHRIHTGSHGLLFPTERVDRHKLEISLQRPSLTRPELGSDVMPGPGSEVYGPVFEWLAARHPQRFKGLGALASNQTIEVGSIVWGGVFANAVLFGSWGLVFAGGIQWATLKMKPR